MENEYFQNDVIDLRILGDIGSVCIYRFPNLIWSQAQQHKIIHYHQHANKFITMTTISFIVFEIANYIYR